MKSALNIRFIEFLLHKRGVFNISNKLLVSLDILFGIREHVKCGEPPGNTASSIVTSALLQLSAPFLCNNEFRYLKEKLYDGYFAFEALTDRDWDSGICEISPIFTMVMSRIALLFLTQRYLAVIAVCIFKFKSLDQMAQHKVGSRCC